VTLCVCVRESVCVSVCACVWQMCVCLRVCLCVPRPSPGRGTHRNTRKHELRGVRGQFRRRRHRQRGIDFKFSFETKKQVPGIGATTCRGVRGQDQKHVRTPRTNVTGLGLVPNLD
jgi:hypothetical protein